MDRRTIDIVCQATTQFYRTQAASFSATRKAPWPGWQRCLHELYGKGYTKAPDRLSFFDMGCGNLRFERYVSEVLPHVRCTFFTADNCAELLAPVPFTYVHQQCNIVEELLRHRENQHVESVALHRIFAAPACNIAVAFGVMHHIPTFDLRVLALRALAAHTTGDGYIIVSLWRFLKDARIARQALKTTQQAWSDLGLSSHDLEEGDCMLGWNGIPGVYRYCHYVSDEELADLVEALRDQVSCVSRFDADGRSGILNTYLLFRRR